MRLTTTVTRSNNAVGAASGSNPGNTTPRASSAVARKSEAPSDPCDNG